MARVFITGSADGLGRLAAQTLLEDGHEVVVHARNHDRVTPVQDLVDRGATAVVGDLSEIGQTPKSLTTTAPDGVAGVHAAAANHAIRRPEPQASTFEPRPQNPKTACGQLPCRRSWFESHHPLSSNAAHLTRSEHASRSASRGYV